MNTWFMDHRLTKRIAGMLTLITFFVCFVMSDAIAAVSSPGTGVTTLSTAINLNMFDLPHHLGQVKDVWNASPDK